MSDSDTPYNARAPAGKAVRVQWCELYPDESKRDAEDFFAEGHTADDLVARMETAPAYVPLPENASPEEASADVPAGYADYLAGRTDLWSIIEHGIPPVQWLVPNLIPKTGVVGTFGTPGAGKTWIMLYAVLSVLRAGEHVMLIDEESGRNRMAKRLAAMGATRDELSRLDHFAYQSGGDLVQFAAIVHYHIRTQNIALVAVDSVSKVLMAFGLDENSNTDCTELAGTLFTPIAAVLDHAVLLLDHMPYGAERPRGATAKTADHDLQWLVENVKEGSPSQRGEILLTRKKDRDGAEPPGYLRFAFGGEVAPHEMVQYIGSGKTVGPTMTSDDAKFAARRQAVIALYGENNAGLSHNEWMRAVAERTGKSEDTAKRRRAELESEGAVASRDGKWFVTQQGYEKYTPYLVQNRPHGTDERVQTGADGFMYPPAPAGIGGAEWVQTAAIPLGMHPLHPPAPMQAPSGDSGDE